MDRPNNNQKTSFVSEILEGTKPAETTAVKTKSGVNENRSTKKNPEGNIWVNFKVMPKFSIKIDEYCKKNHVSHNTLAKLLLYREIGAISKEEYEDQLTFEKMKNNQNKL